MAIVDTGKLALLTLQLSAIAAYKMRLFTNNFAITNATVLSDLTSAAWTGYLDVLLGTMTAATIVSTKAQSAPNTPPVFTNGSIGAVTYYGWCVFDPSGGGTLIAAVNQGLQTLGPGQSVSESGIFTDTTA